MAAVTAAVAAKLAAVAAAVAAAALADAPASTSLAFSASRAFRDSLGGEIPFVRDFSNHSSTALGALKAAAEDREKEEEEEKEEAAIREATLEAESFISVMEASMPAFPTKVLSLARALTCASRDVLGEGVKGLEEEEERGEMEEMSDLFKG